MMQSTSIPLLAKRMRLRKESGENPYILFLGAGISISSGVSNMNEIIDQFLIDFSIVSDEKLSEMDRDERFERFVSEMENLNETERCIWLKRGVEDVEPSAGYTALTRLIEEGYFDMLFTTNWDNLLDLSLERSKIIKNKRDFRFYVRGIDQDDFIIRSFQRFPIPRIKILKLHGDLDSQAIFVTPKQTATFPNEITEFLKLCFRQRDLIIIGHSASDLDIQRCIGIDRQNENTLIYINPKATRNQFVLSLEDNYKLAQEIVGGDAEFDVFMSKLSEEILKLPEAILQGDLGMRRGMPLNLLAKISMDVQKIHENFDWLVTYLRNREKN